MFNFVCVHKTRCIFVHVHVCKQMHSVARCIIHPNQMHKCNSLIKMDILQINQKITDSGVAPDLAN